jgi:LysM repeat protein
MAEYKRKTFYACLIILHLVFYSCVLSTEMRKPETVQAADSTSKAETAIPEEIRNADEDMLGANDLVISEDTGESRIIEIYRDEIQDNCERKFFDLLSFYQNAELSKAKLMFDNLLESLEYLYGDLKLSDRVMLENFWAEFSDKSVKESSPNIFDIYESLYFDEELLSNGKDPNEVVIEQNTEVYQVKQNNANYMYAEEKTKVLFEKTGIKPTDEFIKSVYDNYINYLSDRIGIKETYIRSLKYVKFIKNRLKDNGLSEIYAYIPAVMTSYYEGTKNGSIWRLENTKAYKNIRNNTGASTAEVIRRIKSVSRKGNEFNIIATILETEKYSLEQKDLKKDVLTENFSNFAALVIILTNPDDHDLKSAGSEVEEGNDYLASYENYIKDPKKFVPEKESSKKKTVSQKSKYSKSFIRINHKIKKGDNLQKIADLYGVSVSDLKEWNPKDTGKKYLTPGVVLLIKGYKYQYYTAGSGDSIGKISKKFGMTEQNFKKINNMTKNTVIKGRKYIVKKS